MELNQGIFQSFFQKKNVPAKWPIRSKLRWLLMAIQSAFRHIIKIITQSTHPAYLMHRLVSVSTGRQQIKGKTSMQSLLFGVFRIDENFSFHPTTINNNLCSSSVCIFLGIHHFAIEIKWNNIIVSSCSRHFEKCQGKNDTLQQLHAIKIIPMQK